MQNTKYEDEPIFDPSINLDLDMLYVLLLSLGQRLAQLSLSARPCIQHCWGESGHHAQPSVSSSRELLSFGTGKEGFVANFLECGQAGQNGSSILHRGG